MEVELENVDFNELTETDLDSMKRCVQTLSSVPRGSVPMSRDMGVTGLPRDNSPQEENSYAAEVITQVSEWDDRMSVTEVRYNNEKVKVVLDYVGS